MSAYFFDYNSTTPVDPEALKAMLPFFTEVFANPSGQTSQMSWQSQTAIKTATDQVSDLLNCDSKEVVFTSGATESINWALELFMREKKHILLSEIEHDACFQKANLAENKVFFKSNSDGSINTESFKEALKKLNPGSLVNFILAHNELGTVLDIAEPTKLAKEKGHFVHVDATQALGKIPLDFKSMNIDLLSCSAHKAYGPKGIGALVVNSKTITSLTPLIVGGGQQEGLRSGTLNTPLIVGFGKACDISQDRLEQDQKHFKALRDLFLDEIKSLDFRINGNKESTLLNTLNISFLDWTSPAPFYLDLMPFSVSQSSACAANSSQKRVLSSLGISESNTVRISFGRHTQPKDCKALVKKIKETLIQS